MKKILLTVAVLAMQTARAFNNGATMSLSFDVLSQAKDVYFGYIIDAANKV